MKKILLRADGNNQIGFGHLFRLIALYEMLSEHYECTFLCSESGYTTAISERQIPQSLIPSNENEIEYIKREFDSHEHLIIVDGYQFDKPYFSSLKEIGFTSVYIDDMYQEDYPVDIILNHSPNASPSKYTNSNAQLALGPEYALLRKAFFSPTITQASTSVKDIFVCFGGADPENIGVKIQNILAELDSISTVHVLGKPSQELRKDEEALPIFKYYSNLDEIQISALMDTCQLAIAPSSTICFELCSRQVPTIAGFFIDNQKDIYEGFKKRGCIIPVGDYTKLDEQELKNTIEKCIKRSNLDQVVQKQKMLFDGKVEERILKLIESYA